MQSAKTQEERAARKRQRKANRRFAKQQAQKNGNGNVPVAKMPPRPWRQRKRAGLPQEDEMVMKASGATGTDIRNPGREVRRVGVSSIAVVQQDLVMDVEVNVTTRSLSYLAMGSVLDAMQKGWLASPLNKSAAPYYAFRYLTQAYINSLAGTFPTLQSAPQWFWEINAALLPKTEKFKTSRVGYKGFLEDDSQGLNVQFTLGTGDYEYAVFWGGTGTGADVNDYAILSTPAAYTDDAGQESIQALFQFFEERGLCRRTGAPDPDTLTMTHDTSAFAAVYPEMGASYFNPGGTALTIQSERRINSPIFAKFASYQDGEAWRGWHEYHRSAGSPTYIGPRLAEMFVHRQLRNKVTPIFKWFNFDEFFEVLSLTCCLALEALARAGQPATGCPLTSQQAQLMLRQAILPFFSNHMAQDLRLQSPSWIPFLPFVVGPNGISQGNVGAGPLLPRFIAENVRCSKRVVAKLKPPQGKGFKGTPNSFMEIDLVPILGRPPKSVMSQFTNYSWQEGEGLNDLYIVDPVEVPINLIDASAIVGPGPVYLDLNGLVQPKLVSAWNKWINEISGCLVGLTQLSTDKGCDALCTLPYTNFYKYVVPVPQPPPENPIVGATSPPTGRPKEKEKTQTITTPPASSKGSRRNSVEKKHYGSTVSHLVQKVGAAPSPTNGPSSLFQHVAITGTSSTLGFTSELWKFLSLWVLPENFTVAPVFESYWNAYQTNVVEPIFLPASSAGNEFAIDDDQKNFPLVFDRHMQFATANVRAWNSPVKSEMEEEFEALTQHGDGGFFTKIAGIIGESLGIQGSAQFMNGVGDLTGL